MPQWREPQAIQRQLACRDRIHERQRRFSNLAIETALVLGSVYRLPLRQTEGFVRSLIELMRLDLKVPDHTTLARRRRTVETTDCCWPRKGPVDIVIDSTGLKFHGAGEWTARVDPCPRASPW